MDKLLDVMLKDDLLKSFATLLRAVHLDPRDSEDSSVVSMATLALFGVVISFAKLLYGGSGFSLLAQSPTRNSNLADFRSCQPSHEKESQSQLQPREGGFDSRLEVF